MMSDPDSTSDQPAVPDSRITKPLLASEALMEDLAPQEPWRSGSRWWSILAGLLLLAAVLPSWLWAPPANSIALVAPAVTGGIAILCGAIPLPYVVRAVLMVMLAGVTVGLAFAELGPAAGLNTATQSWWLAHLAAATTLPAALLFRERFRALTRARYVLAFSLMLTAGFVTHCVFTIAGGTLATQITSGIGIAAVVLSFLGFMGAQAPIAGSFLSTLIMLAVSAQLTSVVVARHALRVDLAGAQTVTAMLVFLATILLGALGLAQLLAAVSYRHARSIDFRRVATERAPMPSLSSDSWTGRR